MAIILNKIITLHSFISDIKLLEKSSRDELYNNILSLSDYIRGLSFLSSFLFRLKTFLNIFIY